MKRIGTLLCFFVASIIAFASNVACNRDIVIIHYNLLNLPDTVQFRDGRQTVNKYAADGTRLASTYYTPTSITVNPLSVGEVINLSTYPPYLLDRVRTWFVDNKEYGLMYPEHYDYLELKRIHTPEGYVDQYDNYHYYRRDHLGSVREVWKATDAGAQTVQRTRYYPSGLPWEYQAGDSASLQPYKFNSCEFIETHGYDVTDLGNRGVYHAINRFTSMDRFAEKYPWQSPYVHAGNNPVNFVDVAGDSTYHSNPSGDITMAEATDDNYDELYIVDKLGNINPNIEPLKVNDQSILSELSQKRTNYNGNYAISQNSEISAVFVFLADHTAVEWGLSGFTNKRYVLSTTHKSGGVSPATSISGFDESNLIFKIHSHPGEDGTKGASGDFRDIGSGYSGDMKNIVDLYNRWDKSIIFPNHYIYHPSSKVLYHYTPWESSIYIRKIQNNNRLNFLFPK